VFKELIVKFMKMKNKNLNDSKHYRSLYILSLVNVGIWAIAIIAMVFLIQNSPSIEKIFPILAGGVAVGVSLIASISRTK